MEVKVNGAPESRPDGETVAELVEALGLGGSACAVEVNKVLVPKKEHPQRHIEDGDNVEIVTLVGGG